MKSEYQKSKFVLNRILGFKMVKSLDYVWCYTVVLDCIKSDQSKIVYHQDVSLFLRMIQILQTIRRASGT